MFFDSKDVLCQGLWEREYRIVSVRLRGLGTGLRGYDFGVVDLEGGKFSDVITQGRGKDEFPDLSPQRGSMEECIDVPLSDEGKRFVPADTVFQIQCPIEGFRGGEFMGYDVGPILEGLGEETVCFVEDEEVEVLEGEAGSVEDVFCQPSWGCDEDVDEHVAV